MNHTSLHERRLFVVEARNRRIDKTIDMHETSRHVTRKGIEVVKEKEIELVVDFMRLDSVLRDYAAEWVMVNRDGDEELESTTTLPYEILNEWCSKEINMTDRNESESSDRIVTWNYGRKEHVEKNPFILEEVEGAMKLNSSLGTNESVCSFGVGFDEGIKVGSHIKQLGSTRKEKYTNLKDKVSKLDRRQCNSTPTLEIGSSMSDGDEDFMPDLKELNEARELKRREAKKKEKARKCRSKKSKI
ncbi:hypothetical protein PIB30_023357 [Stylosanthes scabra]|uniref:Uncharacterized protein n=1 Tax=Stylosanthes scabra TaxID=79078 RepID=A0ABU6TA56_9FABA|nr:hypothetical protein [Stylosanthes scabra]